MLIFHYFFYLAVKCFLGIKQELLSCLWIIMEETQAHDDINGCKPEPLAEVFIINMMWYLMALRLLNQLN